MDRSYQQFQIEKVVPLRDKDYYWFLLDRLPAARRRIWVSMFIVNVNRGHDPHREVRSLILTLARAASAGIDVRVLTGDSRQSLAIRHVNMVARIYMKALGLTVRRHVSARPGGTHDKLVIIDDELLVLGSHNWLSESFNDALEDSIAIYSRDMLALAAQEFLRRWTGSESRQKTIHRSKAENRSRRK